MEQKRRIVFRAFSKEDKRMYHDVAIASAGGWIALEYEEDDGDFKTTYTVFDNSSGDVSLMQFAGLLDKNGVDIYEGDIIRDNKGIGVVYFYPPQFVVQCLPDSVAADGIYALAKGIVNIAILEETEVIGNIHETPELIA